MIERDVEGAADTARHDIENALAAKAGMGVAEPFGCIRIPVSDRFHYEPSRQLLGQAMGSGLV